MIEHREIKKGQKPGLLATALRIVYQMAKNYERGKRASREAFLNDHGIVAGEELTFGEDVSPADPLILTDHPIKASGEGTSSTMEPHQQN